MGRLGDETVKPAPSERCKIYVTDKSSQTRTLFLEKVYNPTSPIELIQSEFPFAQISRQAHSDASEFPSPEELIFSPNLVHARNGSESGNLTRLNGSEKVDPNTSLASPRAEAGHAYAAATHESQGHKNKRTRFSFAEAPPLPPCAKESLENRIIHVLNAVEEMGFENLDAVVTAYYTATFAEGSLPHYAQSTSRSRRLRQFLTDLHESSKSWVGREAQGYHDERIAAMEQTYEEEMARLVHSDTRGTEAEDETTSQLFKRDKQFLREQLPEIWSLLSKIARQANTAEADVSRAICVFLYILRVFK
ncbi:hypothetical protein MFIFM68171_02765 [Madurella fahalii]|uniref:Uncharacterized protein n=1 Tax=Madurella fahalii TaxID=1157608 RepID=A0ABQ0G4R7_9PEZI